MERKKIQKSTQSDLIPLDLIIEILSRLPAKSIVRSRSVSKLWSSVTTSPHFINSVADRSRSPCVVLIFSILDQLYIFSSPLQHEKKITYPPVESYQFTIPNNGYSLGFYYSVHGLICLGTNTGLMIWNPITKRFFGLRPIPKYKRGDLKSTFLGYYPIEGRHKALHVHNLGDRIGILTLGAQESWRILTKGSFPSHVLMPLTCGVCVNGVIYYEGYFGSPRARAIMSFDVRTEKFTLIKYPRESYIPGFFVSYHGRLALVISTTNFHFGVELWILEDVRESPVDM